MKTYKLDPEKFSKARRSIILLYILTGIILIIAALWMNWKQLSTNGIMSLMVIPLIVVLFGFSAWRAVKQRQQHWQEYTLQIGDDSIVQNQPRMPDLHIKSSDITDVRETKFGLVLSTERYRNLFGISKDLRAEDYEEVKAKLMSWVA
ncbi:MAG: hypothetical protein ABIG43_01355 [Chloroflexota bacterium]